MFAKDIVEFRLTEELLADESVTAAMRDRIKDGDVYVAKNVIEHQRIRQLRSYLEGIGRGSLPNYQAIEEGCPNFHRINRWDQRAYVQGCFHQFSFFPWNQDVLGLFDLFRPIFQLKNVLSGLSPNSFLGQSPDNDCTARVSIQHYPAGSGALNRHMDPVDYHQLTVPIMIMSKKAEDFKTGGAYVDKSETERVIIDDNCEPGDVIFFNAQVVHGVEPIDPDVETDWLSFKGRWMVLFAVNKLSSNQLVADAVDMEG